MKIENIRIEVAATKEVLEATAWYEKESEQTKEHFVADFEKALNLIRHYPEAWPVLHGQYRKCRLSRFPYLIIYSSDRNEISIAAVMHAKQKPNYWAKRKMA